MSRHPILWSLALVAVVIAFLVLCLFFIVTIAGRGERLVPIFGRGAVAVVEIEGQIFSSADVLKEIVRHEKNDNVKALVVRIESPGGAVAPSQEIFNQIKKFRKTKKVVVSMGAVAASGGYYIATAADRILASPGTITGSIGVIMESFGVQKLIDLARLESRVIKTGPYKDIGSPYRDMTDSEKEYLQGLINDIYGQFKQAVGEERKIDPARVEELAQGKIYTGRQALEEGLVDGLGNLYDALSEAKKLVGLPDDAPVIWPREEPFPLEWLLTKSAWGKRILDFFGKGPGEGSYPLWLYPAGNGFSFH